MSQHLLIVFYFHWLMCSCIEGDNHFDVLRVTDVPFPTSNWKGALVNVTYGVNISEVTICYRFLVESFNSDFAVPFRANNLRTSLGIDTGQENLGYYAYYF